MIAELIVLITLLIMIATYTWFLLKDERDRYPKPNRILWRVLTGGFITIMVTVLIKVIWFQ